MGFRDSQIDWTRKRAFYNPFQMNSILDANTATTAVFRAAKTVGVTSAAFLGMVLWKMATNDLLDGWIVVPFDLDPKFNVGFRVWWTADHDGTGTASASWSLKTSSHGRGTAFTAPATAGAILDTAIAIDNYTDSENVPTVTDNILQITERGIKNSIGLTRKQIEAGSAISLDILLGTIANITQTYILGLEMDYAPMRTEGVGNEIGPPLGANG